MDNIFSYQNIKYISLLDKIKLLFEKELCITTIVRSNNQETVYKSYYKVLKGKIYVTREEMYVIDDN